MDALAQARATLEEARSAAHIHLTRIAAREAYIAMLHAARGYIFEASGKVAKTHHGARSEFGRLATDDPAIGDDLPSALARAYLQKDNADYAAGPGFKPVSDDDARAAIAVAERFIEAVAAALATRP